MEKFEIFTRRTDGREIMWPLTRGGCNAQDANRYVWMALSALGWLLESETVIHKGRALGFTEQAKKHDPIEVTVLKGPKGGVYHPHDKIVEVPGIGTFEVREIKQSPKGGAQAGLFVDPNNR